MNQPHPANPWPAPSKTRKTMKRLGLAGAFVVTFAVGVSVGNVDDVQATPTAAAPQPTYAAPAPTYSVPTYEAPAAQAPAPAPAPSGPATTFSDGVYEVGPDVEPGRYKTTGPDGTGFIDSCYWERSSNDSGEFSAIISNDNISGPGSITVKSGEFVKSSGGCVWTKQ